MGEGDTDTRRTALLRIHGRVQGVGYRAFLREAAAAAGVCGWVRNRRDGTVEALVSGLPAAIAAVLAAARAGPPAGLVDRVDIADAPPGTDRPAAGMAVLPTC
jgi:acylphosphatase